MRPSTSNPRTCIRCGSPLWASVTNGTMWPDQPIYLWFCPICSGGSGATGVERSTADDEAPNPAPEATQEEEA